MKISIPETSGVSAPHVRWVAPMLGLLLTTGMLAISITDRSARVRAAEAHTQAEAQALHDTVRAHALGIVRYLHAIGPQADAAMTMRGHGRSAGLLPPDIGTSPRPVNVYDGTGRPLLAKTGAWHTLPTLVAQARREAGILVSYATIGAADGAQLWIGVQTPAGHWVVTPVPASELAAQLDALEIGSDGIAIVHGRNGIPLASQGAGTTPRFTHCYAPPDSPFQTEVGVARADYLAAWERESAAALATLLVYWLAVAFVIRRVSRSEAYNRAAYAELQRYAGWLRLAQDAANTGIWVLDPDLEQARLSGRALEILGRDADASPVPIEDFLAHVHEDDRADEAELLQHALREQTDFQSEFRIIRTDGSLRWVSSQGGARRDHDGAYLLAGTLQDITARRQQQAKLEQAEQQFRELFDLNPLPFWVFDVQTLRFLAVNETAVRHYGYRKDEFLAMTILDIRPEVDREAVRAAVAMHDEHDGNDHVWTHLTRDGQALSVRVHTSTIVFGGHDARLVLAEDVTERVAYERDLAWRASHDETTGLLKKAAMATAFARRTFPGALDVPLAAAIHVQLRDLDIVDSVLGQAAARDIVRLLGQRLCDALCERTLVGFDPSSAFVVLVPVAANASLAVQRIEAVLAQPLETDHGSHRVDAWIGVAAQNAPQEPLDAVIGHAALACVQARKERLPLMHYTSVLSKRAEDRLATIPRLRQAVNANAFHLAFQPIVAADDGRLLALEALLRWTTDDGPVPPDTFIPLCEESGLIVPIGEWVLHACAEAHCALALQYAHDIPIAVNVSAVQFMTGALPETVDAVQRTYGLPPGALQVELTESAMMRRPALVREAVRQLREQGCGVSVDDFGTGYASMGYLRDLPVDKLKIDRSFVRGVHRDARIASICRSIIALGHGLGLQVVAEGVECDEERAWLRAEGADQIQGFLIARPMTMPDLLAWMAGPGRNDRSDARPDPASAVA
ncbi:GGDEF domain-containing phosphodiesterase [Pseudoxanthomonas japonensis]|uniref:PAS domain S-box-containing protein n=1 Tax=Pseudoxanthomonas japonensis TaxID=69284 RepID=A0ABQ6ZKY6_9GAMM|nr:GGDEF domain-containing phosphodiesterase [Pseudoxanthomonas japonensis]KAF1726907.1 hypothetical protein CSC78_02050 [Pseudoxanthomonas japonensis]